MTSHEDSFANFGELRTKIDLLGPVEAVDDFRGTPEQETVHSCWSRWTPIVGTRSLAVQQAYGRVTSTVLVRYNPAFRSGLFVRKAPDGKQAAIAGVTPVGEGQRFLELLVNEIE